MSKSKTTIDEELLRNIVKSHPRKAQAIKVHAQRITRMQQLIEKRYGIVNPRQWRAKHVRWLMKDGLNKLSPATTYDYWRTCRLILEVRGVYADWESHLRGPWLNPKGTPYHSKRNH